MHHICYSLTVIMNIIVVSVFWLMLAKDHFEKELPEAANGDEKLLALYVLNAYCNHIIPGVCTVILVATTDCVLMMGKIRFILFVAAAYISFNFYAVKVKGEAPTYFFLTYDSA